MVELRFAMVCASNVNRSVAAHALLKEAGLEVESYGVGSSVKLPGEAVTTPNRYAFDSVAYEDILKDLRGKNEEYYRSLGIIDMLERDIKVKRGPKKWQSRRRDEVFDVVVAFEQRVYDIVVADLQQRNGSQPCIVINMEVKDSASEAVLAAPEALKLCQAIQSQSEDDWEDNIEDILGEFTTQGRKMSYDICYQ
jgi:RNA polymerase II subunit A C-terminal domain phosphatase SSU72